MAYDTDVYRIGRWQIAATLLHEMGHLARFPTKAECENTMDAANTYAPLIRSVRPRRVTPGDTVTISGISFGPSQESTDRITLNGADVGRALSWRWRHAGQGQIRFRVPQGAASGPLVVENNRVRSNAVSLTIVPAAEEAGAAGAQPVLRPPPHYRSRRPQTSLRAISLGRTRAAAHPMPAAARALAPRTGSPHHRCIP